jgi:hypothetical protein
MTDRITATRNLLKIRKKRGRKNENLNKYIGLTLTSELRERLDNEFLSLTVKEVEKHKIHTMSDFVRHLLAFALENIKKS